MAINIYWFNQRRQDGRRVVVRVSAQEKLRTRRRIIDTASRRYRKEGIDNVGVAGLMASVGLTHGGFYKHFDSKTELVMEATRLAFADSADTFAQRSERGGIAAVVNGFLQAIHRDAEDGGCPSAALGSIVPQQETGVQLAYRDGINSLLAQIEAALPNGGRRSVRRRRSIGVLNQLVGAVLISRAVSLVDPALSTEILASARRQATLSVDSG